LCHHTQKDYEEFDFSFLPGCSDDGFLRPTKTFTTGASATAAGCSCTTSTANTTATTGTLIKIPLAKQGVFLFVAKRPFIAVNDTRSYKPSDVGLHIQAIHDEQK
jgi:hypothetical protein